MKTASIVLLGATLGCAFAKPVSAADALKWKEQVLHSFGASPDGAEPYAGVINKRGTLYGTTEGGSAYDAGTVFALDRKTGAETAVYSFVDTLQTGLIDVKGTLYGTTSGLDGEGPGSVFALDPSTGAETVLYSFTGGADGAYPSSLVKLNGKLYGTADWGGNAGCNGFGCGTVFAIDLKTGAESTVYSFCSQQNCADGAGPSLGGGLIDVNGALYGVTQSGGGSGCNGYGCGTVFSIDPSTGAETVLYSFGGGADGAAPAAGLIDVNGILYGTTSQGGGTGCNNGVGCGTVFSIDPITGSEKVLHAFCSQQNCADGADPLAGLIDVNGILYGTTIRGGNTGCGGIGCGAAFSVDPSTGTETVIYVFCSEQNCADGRDPEHSLIAVNGNLYGTTVYGGTDLKDCGSGGCGTAFVLKQKG